MAQVWFKEGQLGAQGQKGLRGWGKARTNGRFSHRTKTILVPQSCTWLPALATLSWWTGCCIMVVGIPPWPRKQAPCLSTTLPPKETSPP